MEGAIAQRREALRRLGVQPDDPNRSAKLREIERRVLGEEIAARSRQAFLPTPVGSAIEWGREWAVRPVARSISSDLVSPSGCFSQVPCSFGPATSTVNRRVAGSTPAAGAFRGPGVARSILRPLRGAGRCDAGQRLLEFVARLFHPLKSACSLRLSTEQRVLGPALYGLHGQVGGSERPPSFGRFSLSPGA